MGLPAILSSLVALIPKTLYVLTMSLLSLIDVFQLLFRKLAGLDCYYVAGEAQTGDIIYDFLRGILFGEYPILSNVFFGLLILGFILLFLSTIVAIIRNEYTTEKAENSKGKIIGKAFKSVLYFAIVPIVVLFGVYLANIVLVAVDSATRYNTNYGTVLDVNKLKPVNVSSQTLGSTQNVQQTYITYSIFGWRDSATNMPYGTTTTTFSGTIFKAAAYSANRIRTTANNPTDPADGNCQNFGYLLKTGKITTFGGLFGDPNGNTENIAVQIDTAFADNVIFKTPAQLDYSSQYTQEINDSSILIWPSQEGVMQDVADKFNVNLVWYYYDLWSFNWVIGIGAAIIMVTIFINIIFGLMKRIVEMIGLFLMAPPLIGLMPLDGEKGYKEWQKSFVKKALMAYGAVGGMNIIFLILPELQTISFFNNGAMDNIVNTLLVLIALLAVKDFINVVSGLVGGEDANKTGGDVGKDVAGMAAKGLQMGMSTIGLAAGAGGLVKRTVMKGAGAIQTAKRAYDARVDPTSDHKRLTNLAKDAMREQHEAEAKQEAKEASYQRYRAKNIDFLDKTLTDKHSKDYDAGLATLKTNDGAAYQKVLEEKLRKQYAEDLKNEKKFFKTDSGELKTLKEIEKKETDALYRQKQANVHVTNQDAFEMTGLGALTKQIDELKKDSATASSRITKARNWKSGVGAIGSYATGHAVDIVKPAFPAVNNAITTNLSIFAENNFVKEFAGKGGENIKDMVYRVSGRTFAEVKKAKEKAESAEKEAKSMRLNAQAIADAINGKK